MTDPTSTNGEWRFDDLRALYLKRTLKRSPEPSHTQGLIDRSPSRPGTCCTWGRC
jgi:hypothetical protein